LNELRLRGDLFNCLHEDVSKDRDTNEKPEEEEDVADSKGAVTEQGKTGMVNPTGTELLLVGVFVNESLGVLDTKERFEFLALPEVGSFKVLAFNLGIGDGSHQVLRDDARKGKHAHDHDALSLRGRDFLHYTHLKYIQILIIIWRRPFQLKSLK